ncbi:DUF4870 domain-containing protein [Caldinitratiruptor microaerophilus]|uniref:DUF4870 domain-containing protein n=1 Tax=Caldinitratiruptor microaerophilus TaxID=671077 RepID=A0AA35G6J4_9FIRM|nr:DUF4870 domain-containing protein [Caldinitratiruptor microaerophilus]BDG61411.1 hypothetical protein caldi_25010 [Caldinitratiruptor microaerophilus]
MGPSYEERVMAAVGHLGVLFGLMGVVATGVIHFLYARRSGFVGAHVRQALAWQGTALAVKVAYGYVALGGLPGALVATGWSWDVLKWLFQPDGPPGRTAVAALLWVFFALALQGLVRAWGGRRHRYPLVGRLVS